MVAMGESPSTADELTADQIAVQQIAIALSRHLRDEDGAAATVISDDGNSIIMGVSSWRGQDDVRVSIQINVTP